MYIRASLALVGEGLEPRQGVCIGVSADGLVESIEGWGSCPADSLGGSWAVALPQPANAHVHSADGAFPEFSVTPAVRASATGGGLRECHMLLLGHITSPMPASARASRSPLER